MRPQAILIIAALFLVALILMTLGLSGYRKVETIQTLEAHAEALRENHPEIEHLRVGTLQLLLNSGAKIHLIDVRDESAFAISHLPGSLNLQSLAEFQELEPPSAELLVFYGNPDPEAAELAKEISAETNTRTAHLAGGIFAWANSSGDLVDEAGIPANTVDPGAKFQGHLLRKELRHGNKETP